MILNWAVHYLLTNWQASQALADWRVYTAQGTFYERSVTALTASLVATVAIFLMPFVIFWSPDHQIFSTEVCYCPNRSMSDLVFDAQLFWRSPECDGEMGEENTWIK
jgi:hypothetical protein